MKERVSSVLRKDGREKRNGKRENKSAEEEEEEGDRAKDEGRTGICERMPTGQFLLLYSTTRGCQYTSYTHTDTHR